MTRRGGYSLLQTIVYLALFILISVLVTNSLLTLMRVLSAAQVKSDVTNNAAFAIGRMEREIRRAKSVSAITADNLTLDTGTRFFRSAGALKESYGGANEALLTETRFNLSSLSFYATSSVKSELVSFSFGLENERFFGSALLRGSY